MSEIDPKLLLSSVDELQAALACVICSDSLRQPTDTACGHTFCKECIERALKSEGGAGGCCPLCKTPMTRRGLRTTRRTASVVEALTALASAARATIREAYPEAFVTEVGVMTSPGLNAGVSSGAIAAAAVGANKDDLNSNSAEPSISPVVDFRVLHSPPHRNLRSSLPSLADSPESPWLCCDKGRTSSNKRHNINPPDDAIGGGSTRATNKRTTSQRIEEYDFVGSQSSPESGIIEQRRIRNRRKAAVARTTRGAGSGLRAVVARIENAVLEEKRRRSLRKSRMIEREATMEDVFSDEVGSEKGIGIEEEETLTMDRRNHFKRGKVDSSSSSSEEEIQVESRSANRRRTSTPALQRVKERLCGRRQRGKTLQGKESVQAARRRRELELLTKEVEEAENYELLIEEAPSSRIVSTSVPVIDHLSFPKTPLTSLPTIDDISAPKSGDRRRVPQPTTSPWRRYSGLRPEDRESDSASINSVPSVDALDVVYEPVVAPCDSIPLRDVVGQKKKSLARDFGVETRTPRSTRSTTKRWESDAEEKIIASRYEEPEVETQPYILETPLETNGIASRIVEPSVASPRDVSSHNPAIIVSKALIVAPVVVSASGSFTTPKHSIKSCLKNPQSSGSKGEVRFDVDSLKSTILFSANEDNVRKSKGKDHERNVENGRPLKQKDDITSAHSEPSPNIDVVLPTPGVASELIDLNLMSSKITPIQKAQKRKKRRLSKPGEMETRNEDRVNESMREDPFVEKKVTNTNLLTNTNENTKRIEKAATTGNKKFEEEKIDKSVIEKGMSCELAEDLSVLVDKEGDENKKDFLAQQEQFVQNIEENDSGKPKDLITLNNSDKSARVCRDLLAEILTRICDAVESPKISSPEPNFTPLSSQHLEAVENALYEPETMDILTNLSFTPSTRRCFALDVPSLSTPSNSSVHKNGSQDSTRASSGATKDNDSPLGSKEREAAKTAFKVDDFSDEDPFESAKVSSTRESEPKSSKTETMNLMEEWFENSFTASDGRSDLGEKQAKCEGESIAENDLKSIGTFEDEENEVDDKNKEASLIGENSRSERRMNLINNDEFSQMADLDNVLFGENSFPVGKPNILDGKSTTVPFSREMGNNSGKVAKLSEKIDDVERLIQDGEFDQSFSDDGQDKFELCSNATVEVQNEEKVKNSNLARTKENTDLYELCSSSSFEAFATSYDEGRTELMSVQRKKIGVKRNAKNTAAIRVPVLNPNDNLRISDFSIDSDCGKCTQDLTNSQRERRLVKNIQKDMELQYQYEKNFKRIKRENLYCHVEENNEIENFELCSRKTDADHPVGKTSDHHIELNSSSFDDMKEKRRPISQRHSFIDLCSSSSNFDEGKSYLNKSHKSAEKSFPSQRAKPVFQVLLKDAETDSPLPSPEKYDEIDDGSPSFENFLQRYKATPSEMELVNPFSLCSQITDGRHSQVSSAKGKLVNQFGLCSQLTEGSSVQNISKKEKDSREKGSAVFTECEKSLPLISKKVNNCDEILPHVADDNMNDLEPGLEPPPLNSPSARFFDSKTPDAALPESIEKQQHPQQLEAIRIDDFDDLSDDSMDYNSDKLREVQKEMEEIRRKLATHGSSNREDDSFVSDGKTPTKNKPASAFLTPESKKRSKSGSSTPRTPRTLRHGVDLATGLSPSPPKPLSTRELEEWKERSAREDPSYSESVERCRSFLNRVDCIKKNLLGSASETTIRPSTDSPVAENPPSFSLSPVTPRRGPDDSLVVPETPKSSDAPSNERKLTGDPLRALDNVAHTPRRLSRQNRRSPRARKSLNLESYADAFKADSESLVIEDDSDDFTRNAKEDGQESDADDVVMSSQKEASTTTSTKKIKKAITFR